MTPQGLTFAAKTFAYRFFLSYRRSLYAQGQFRRCGLAGGSPVLPGPRFKGEVKVLKVHGVR